MWAAPQPHLALRVDGSRRYTQGITWRQGASLETQGQSLAMDCSLPHGAVGTGGVVQLLRPEKWKLRALLSPQLEKLGVQRVKQLEKTPTASARKI